MSFEITGRLILAKATEQKTDKFSVRELVIETSGQYPQKLKFQLTNDRCDLLDNYKEGDDIKVYFDLRGSEWQEKYFVNLNAWKLEPLVYKPIENGHAYSNFPEPTAAPLIEDTPF